jgi:hypothetical protein
MKELGLKIDENINYLQDELKKTKLLLSDEISNQLILESKINLLEDQLKLWKDLDFTINTKSI